jgi:hypothetical protein
MADIAGALIASAQNYAAGALAAGINAMDSAINVLDGLQATVLKDPLKNVSLTINPPSPGDPGDVPSYTGIHLEPSVFTDVEPILQSVPSLILPPDPAQPPPDLVYNDPQKPSGISPNEDLLADIPTISALPALPPTPNLEAEIQGITAPTLTPITIPAAPVYVAPEFAGTPPVFSATMPKDLDLQYESAYSTASPIMQAAVNAQLSSFIATYFPNFSTGMAAIEARLATYLQGGTALTPAVEDALYNRTLDKTNKDAVRATQEVLQKAARSGQTMLGPTIVSQLQDVDQERRNNNARSATEIYIKQAELEQSNLQFAVTKSSELRKIALDAAVSYFHGLVNVNGQALEYARGVVDAVVRAFDVAAKYAETQARIYEADAQVYRAKLEGALAVLHAFEAEVRGLEAQANVDVARVTAYRARIEAVQAEANVYKAAVESVVALAGLERIKVELYDAKVKAFGSQVNAFTSQWQGYEAAVKGQTARMEVNIGHSREYEARANAFTAIVKGRQTAVESALATNKNLIDNYRIQVEAFSALQHAKAEAVGIDVNLFKAEVEAYIGKAQAIAEHSKAEVAVYDVQLRSLIAEANVLLEISKEINKVDVERVLGVAQVSQTIGREYGAIAQAALNGMNTLAADVVSSTV